MNCNKDDQKKSLLFKGVCIFKLFLD